MTGCRAATRYSASVYTALPGVGEGYSGFEALVAAKQRRAVRWPVGRASGLRRGCPGTGAAAASFTLMAISVEVSRLHPVPSLCTPSMQTMHPSASPEPRTC
jgi:hypothetical protein